MRADSARGLAAAPLLPDAKGSQSVDVPNELSGAERWDRLIPHAAVKAGDDELHASRMPLVQHGGISQLMSEANVGQVGTGHSRGDPLGKQQGEVSLRDGWRPVLEEEDDASRVPKTTAITGSEDSAPTAQLPPSPRPLATVVVLTCNRPRYASLAVRQIAEQDYRPLEVLVVDDGTAAVEPLLRLEHPDLVVLPERRPEAGVRETGAPANATAQGLSVRLLALPGRLSIGAKRMEAARAARGEVLLHWDDDDFHEPRRVSAQVKPILAGDADITAVQLTRVALMPGFRAFATRTSLGILFSSLAYRTALAREQGFANVSLGEDYEFADRAVRACHRFKVVDGIESFYTRHGSSLGNTYAKFPLQHALDSEALVRISTPPWLSSTTLASAEEAEADASGLACPVVSQQLPLRFDPAKSHVPYMPAHCCSSPGDAGCLKHGDAQPAPPPPMVFSSSQPSCPASPRRGGFAQTRATGLMTGYATKTGMCATLAPTAPTATSNPFSMTFAPPWASAAPCISTLSLEDPAAGRMAKYMTTNSVAQAEAPVRVVPARPRGPMAPDTNTTRR